MSKFSYLVANSIEEAIKMYKNNLDSNPMYLAGGTDLLLKIRNGVIKSEKLISFKDFKKHNRIVLDDKTGILKIGAFTTHREIEKSDLIFKKYKIIYDAITNIGSVQIRNIATIGGNIVNAAPSADSILPLLSLDSFLVLHGINGVRKVSLLNFFEDSGKTILKPGEILTDIIIPKIYSGSVGAYKKFSRRSSMELPIISVGIMLVLDKNSFFCRKARICLGVAAPVPIRAIEAEKFLFGKNINEKVLTEAGFISAEESRPRDSFRGKSWYRREIISVLIKKVGLLALSRAKKI